MDEFDNDTAMPVTPDPENPFSTPMASTVSLNAPGDSAIMTEASADSTQNLAGSSSAPSDGQNNKSRPPPPPQPLNLPQPRSPPPHSGTPHINQAPEPIPPPTVTEEVHEEELPEKRWWTDWLCGCRAERDDQVRSCVYRARGETLLTDPFRLLERTHSNDELYTYILSTTCIHILVTLSIVVAIRLYPYHFGLFRSQCIFYLHAGLMFIRLDAL